MVVRGAVGLCVASVGLGDIHVLFAWQAWHLVTSQVLLHGRHGSYGTGLALAAHLVQVRTLCGMRSLAAMAQVPWVGSGGALSPHWSPRAPRHVAWQARDLATSTFPLCGRRHLVTSQLLLRGSPGTCSHRRCFCVACVASGTYGTGLALVARLVAVAPLPFCTAGVALCEDARVSSVVCSHAVCSLGLWALALLDCRSSHHITLDFVLWRAFHCHVRRCQHVVKATLGI